MIVFSCIMLARNAFYTFYYFIRAGHFLLHKCILNGCDGHTFGISKKQLSTGLSLIENGDQLSREITVPTDCAPI